MEDFIILEGKTEKDKKKRFVLICIIICITVAFTVGFFILLSTIRASKYEKIVRVEGYVGLGSLIPGDAREDLGGQLYYLLQNHFDLPNDNEEIVARIRNDSFKVVSDREDYNALSFVLDIDKYEQTYGVTVGWSNDEIPNNVAIECTTRKESKYPQAVCYGMTTSSESVKLYLPYEFSLSSGEKVNVTYGFTTDDGKDILRIEVESCGSKKIEDVALSHVESWVRALGLNFDSIVFKIEPKYDNCLIRGE